jgi:hypothetical protein
VRLFFFPISDGSFEGVSNHPFFCIIGSQELAQQLNHLNVLYTPITVFVEHKMLQT